MSEERIDDIDYWWQGGFPGAFAAEVRGKSLDRPQRGAINRCRRRVKTQGSLPNETRR
jgi:hypothetical protein